MKKLDQLLKFDKKYTDRRRRKTQLLSIAENISRAAKYRSDKPSQDDTYIVIPALVKAIKDIEQIIYHVEIAIGEKEPPIEEMHP